MPARGPVAQRLSYADNVETIPASLPVGIARRHPTAAESVLVGGVGTKHGKVDNTSLPTDQDGRDRHSATDDAKKPLAMIGPAATDTGQRSCAVATRQSAAASLFGAGKPGHTIRTTMEVGSQMV